MSKPTAWVWFLEADGRFDCGMALEKPEVPGATTIPLYTKKSWVGLTEDEIWPLAQDYGDLSWQNCTLDFARAIEAKLKEKNGW